MDTLGQTQKKAPSQFSATMIGVHDAASAPNKDDYARQAYKEEAKQVADFLTGVHHARKLPHMQLNYSDTVNKLSKQQKNVPVEVPPPVAAEPPRHSKNHEFAVVKQDEYLNSMRNNLKEEMFINDRKRRYNRSVGNTASIKAVFEGTAPMPKHAIFPQKATHSQILAMTGALKMPDPNKLPPDVGRGKKWLGDGVGWEGATGGSSARGGFGNHSSNKGPTKY